MIHYDGRIFRPLFNSENGEVDPGMQFHYKQSGNLLTSEYTGAHIRLGHLIATVDEKGCLDMRYHQVNDRGEITTGLCKSTPEIKPDGKIRLHEKWQWTSGDLSEGESVFEEI